MNSRRLHLLASGLPFCSLLTFAAPLLAQDAPPPAAPSEGPADAAPSAPEPSLLGRIGFTSKVAPSIVPPLKLNPAVDGAATATADTGPGTWEDTWVPWDTGEKEAGLGFAFFGHLGLGHRFNDPPGSVGEPSGRNGLRVGITGIFRPIRYFGFGVGYEHADLDRDRTDTGDVSYKTTFRDLNILWIDARVYPLRVDPFALYINIAGGPGFQTLSADSVEIEASSVTSTRCEGSGSAGFAMKGAVGAEFALVSGAILWGEVGPDYYLLSEDSLDGCEVGAGNAGMIGFRAGFAIGFERTKVRKEVPPPPKPQDDDLDTILNPVDACPTVAGVPNADPTKHGCPPPKDQDGDTIIDDLDACPTVAGIADADPKKNGCPPPADKDADGVIDELDACVDIPGVATEDPKTNGCPPDTDGDGFRDDQDACPQEKGVDDPDATKRGCPKLVRVTDTEIIILEQVQFDTGKATIKPVSDPLLGSVAQVLKEHAEILKLEVQGHTDNKGPKQLNATLSQNRAESVKKALEKRGVDASRLVPKGYGQDKPIDDNKTDAGRQKNRRVQFVVLEKKPRLGPTTKVAPPMAPVAPVTPAPGTPPTPAPVPAPVPPPAPGPAPTPVAPKP